MTINASNQVVQGSDILASDYNTIQSRVGTILGVGSGDKGYGQALASAQVAVGNTVTAQQMLNLKTDLDKISFKIQNSASTAPTVSVGGQILASDWTTYNSQSINFDGTTRFTLASQQASFEDPTGGRATNTNWNAKWTHKVNVVFASANDARYFFNTGSEIRIKPNNNAASSPITKGRAWQLLFAQLGTNGLRFRAHDTLASAGTIPANTGFYEIANNNTDVQILFIQDSGTYSGNDLVVKVRKSADQTTLIFTMEYNDDGSFGATPPGDEAVNGTTTSQVGWYKATSNPVNNYVTVLAPTLSINNT